jgi:hypothetical protein
MDSLQVYIAKIVALGQRTLALSRRGEYLPEELVEPARELLALERTLGLSLDGPTGTEAAAAAPSLGAREDVLVLDVEEEPGGGPEVIRDPLDILPPLVVDIVDEEIDRVPREIVTPPAQASVSAAEPRVCGRCGELLRPGSRFCHRCGQRWVAPS